MSYGISSNVIRYVVTKTSLLCEVSFSSLHYLSVNTLSDRDGTRTV